MMTVTMTGIGDGNDLGNQKAKAGETQIDLCLPGASVHF